MSEENFAGDSVIGADPNTGGTDVVIEPSQAADVPPPGQARIVGGKAGAGPSFPDFMRGFGRPHLDSLHQDERVHVAGCDDCVAGEGGFVVPCGQFFRIQSRKIKASYLGPTTVELPRVLNDRVLLRVIQREEEKHGSIILPDTATERPNEGEVLATGRGRILDNGTRVAPDLEVGRRVFYGRYSGTELRFGDEKIIILREDEILAVLPEKVQVPAMAQDQVEEKTDEPGCVSPATEG